MKPQSIKNQEDKISTKNALNDSLRHLEFILFFEMHLEQKQKSNCSTSFLEAFEDLKHDAQMNVLKHSIHCKGS